METLQQLELLTILSGAGLTIAAALVGVLLKRARNYVKSTETKLDDMLLEVAEDVAEDVSKQLYKK